MTLPLIPHKFTTARNLDMEDVNDDLDASARAIQASLDKRYTYSTLIFPVDGITDASVQVLREVAIRRPGASNAVEVCSVEVVIYAAGAVVWTLACSDTTWPSITVTAAGATTEATASSGVPVSVPSSSADLTFTLSGAAASTITRGYIVVHLRCDRGNQGTSHAGYTPTLLDSTSSTAGATLDTELTARAAAAARDLANNVDLRCELFAVRASASGTTTTFRTPSGARRLLGSTVYVVGAAGSIATATVTGTNLSGSTAVATSTGASARDATTDAASGTMPDDPMDTADNATIAVAITGGVTADLAYVLVWWS